MFQSLREKDFLDALYHTLEWVKKQLPENNWGIK